MNKQPTTPNGHGSMLVVTFGIFDEKGNPVPFEGHNAIGVELAEDIFFGRDFYYVSCELEKALERMSVKGLATHLFYQPPASVPSERPPKPNRKGLVRHFQYHSWRTELPALPPALRNGQQAGFAPQ